MPNTYVDYVAAVDTSYVFSFPYIDVSHVKVYVNSSARTQGTHYTVATSPTRVVFTNGNAPALGASVRIKRETYKDAPYVDFTNGATILESDLDRSFQQNLFISQENAEESDEALKLGEASVNYSAKNKRITDLAEPNSSQDAATRQFVTNYTDTALRNAGGLTPNAWTFLGDGATLSFSLGAASATSLTAAPSYIVVVGGVVQTPTINYTLSISSGLLYLNFIQAPAASVAISVVQLGYRLSIAELSTEEGSWTPQYLTTTGELTSVPYTNRWGTYTKTGNTVFYSGEINASPYTASGPGSSGGNLLIAGLPFNCEANKNFTGTSAQSLGFSSMPHEVLAYRGASTVNLQLLRRGTGSSNSTAITVLSWASNTTVNFAGWFKVAE